MPSGRKSHLSPASYPSAQLVRWGAQWWEWIHAHQRTLTLWASVAGVMVLGVIIVTVYWRSQWRQGLEDLRQGIVALQEENLDSAVSLLRSAQRRLPNSEARQLALLRLGDTYLQQERLEEARQAYTQVVGTEDSYLKQLALVALGREAEQDDDFELARQLYVQAAELEGPATPEALLAAARVLEAAGDAAASQAYYETFLEKYPDFPLAEVARQRKGE